MRWRARPSRGAGCGHRAASSLSGGDSGRRKTGTNADRPGYQLMLRELPKIKPAYVAVWKNDRLARDRAELLLVKQAIRSVGARVHYIEGISPTYSPDSVLMEGVADAFAEYYSLQLSANIRRGQRITPSEHSPTATRSSVSLWTRTSATSRTRRRLPSSRRSSTITPRACLCRKSVTS
ncbi:recombinase family protein [Corynebacterium argentoratense]|uniref:recombinase family protein n=1 Tax=Corynebacterium argentoratense TaxID=42817 RepID=UPI00191BCFCC